MSTFEDMVKDRKPVLQADAMRYAEDNGRRLKSGCYIHYCLPLGGCPIGCGYNCASDSCLCVGFSSYPFACFVLPLGYDGLGTYTSWKQDFSIMQVGRNNSTIACFLNNCCQLCYCQKVC